MKGFIQIKTPQPVTVESLYALMQSDGQFELPYETHGSGKMMSIRFQLSSDNIIQVSASGKAIGLQIAKSNHLKDIGLHALTSGWSTLLDSSKKDNQALLERVAAEIRRITGGK